MWRGFAFLALVALGVCIALLASHHYVYGGAWVVITAGWFGTAMWLWRAHMRES